MNPFLVYKMAIAMRLHFTTDAYDIVKMKGQVRTTEQAYVKRRDVVYGTQRLARKYSLPQIVDFFVANFVAGANWGRLFDAESEGRYRAWLARKESQGYLYKEELNNLCELVPSWQAIFNHRSGHPPILKAYLNGTISPETLVILEMSLPYVDRLSTYLGNDVIWPDVARLIRKYTPFVKVNKDKYRAVTRSIITHHFPEET